jgi:hypothetical protein
MGPVLRFVILGSCLSLSFGAASLVAQTPGPESTTTSDGSVTITARYEAHRDRLRYEFASPSSIDTTFLVRHSFEQKYVGDNHWLVVSARYPAAGTSLETETAFTPQRQTSGSDFDTFYNPGGDVVVSGTGGDVRMRSLRFTQWSEAWLFRLAWRVGYSYRRDRSEFLPADIVLTHSNPPSERRRFTTDRETTTSESHELLLDLSKPLPLNERWTVVPGVTLSPLLRARLTTILPDKYPGEDLVYELVESALAARLQFAHRNGGRLIVWGMTWGQSWSYSKNRVFDRTGISATARVGWVRR